MANQPKPVPMRSRNRRVWLLTAVGLGTGVLMLCTGAWSLTRIKADRVSSDSIRTQTTLLAGRADALLAEYMRQSKELLDGRVLNKDDVDPVPDSRVSSVLSDDSGTQQIDERLSATASELSDALLLLRKLNADCRDYSQQFHATKFQRSESLSSSDKALRAMRASLASAEGMQLLRMARLIRQYRKLEGDKATNAADEILNKWSPKTKQADLMSELADLAMFRERLIGETNIDDLVSLRDNRIQPCLSRLHRLIDSNEDSGARKRDTKLLATLETSLFGAGFQQSKTHQSIKIGDGGLYSDCVAALGLELEKNRLEVAGASAVSEFRDIQRRLHRSVEKITAESAARAGQLVGRAWYTMLFTGCLSGLAFLFLASKVARTIERQFNRLTQQSKELARKTEEAEKLSLVAKYTDNSVVITDADGNVEWVNEGFQRITGYSLKDVEGRVLISVLQGPGTANEGIQKITHGFETGQPFDVEINEQRKDGDEIIVSIEARPISDANGDVRHFFLMERDITQRQKEHEERLRLTEALQESVEYTTKLALVAQHTSNAVIVSDSDGCVEWVNAGFTRLTEYSLGEVSGQRPADFLYGTATDPNTIQKVEDAIQNQSGFRGELINYNKSGGTYWIDMEILPVPDENGDVVRFISIVSDISERKAAASEKELMESQLRSVAHQAGMAEVATGVLHNVGNVLNSVNVSANVLQDMLMGGSIEKLSRAADILTENEPQLADFLTQDERGKCFPKVFRKIATSICDERDSECEELRSLQDNINHIKHIVSMQQSNAKHGGLIDEVSPSDILEDALKLNGEALTRHQIQILKEYNDVPLVKLDKHQTLQVLVNLITNAKQALDETDQKEKTITLRVVREDDFVCVDVKDNGPGMTDEVLGKLFQHRFTTKKDGHGFGLHASALSAQDMGGSLKGYSDGPGTGATFTLRLPLACPEAAAVSAT